MLQKNDKRTILIVEDNPDSLTAFLKKLEKDWKYRITLNLSDAIKVLKGNEHDFSLILLDQNLSDWITPKEVVNALTDDLIDKNIELYNSIRSMNREGLLLIPWLVQHEEKYKLNLKVIVTSFHQNNDLMRDYLAENDKTKLFMGFIPKPLTITKFSNLIKKEGADE